MNSKSVTAFLREARRFFLTMVIFAIIAESNRAVAEVNLVVAADGSGQFKSVQAAIMSVPSGSAANPVIIHIQPGIYKELIYVQREKSFFKLIGENPTNTILTFDLYAGMTNVDGKPIGTFKTPSTTIDADDFTAENITFENSAGPVGQALAIRVDGDRATFRNCRFLGWQDTILLNRGRDYFENCYIAGHVDFIFGGATAWFENCQIHCLRNGYITAASTPSDQPFGFVFSHCQITGEPGVKTYLGRPWRIYASTIYLNCEMSDVVRPEGWNDWKKPETHQTARYAEFNSTGAGANPQARAPWAKQLTPAEAENVTATRVLDGWNPVSTGSADSGITLTNIEYGKADGKKLLLDAHVPDGDGPFPMAILVHGGGWSTGNKEGDIRILFKTLSDANFIWFTINYRLAPTNRWPDCFEDMQTAIRWVKAHASEFKGDPHRLALIGYSAGGHLVCLAATLAKKNTRVQAVVGLAPVTDLVTEAKRRGSLDKWPSMKMLLGRDSLDAKTLKTLAEISPIDHVKSGLPPFLLIQGNTDKSVPYEQTVNFETALKRDGVPCNFITITNGTHAIANWERLNANYKMEMISWLKETLGTLK